VTYDEIVAGIKLNVGRADATANTNAQAAADRALRAIEGVGNWYWMEAVKEALTPTSPDPTERIALPRDWKELRDPPSWFDHTSTDKMGTPLDTIDEEEALATYSDTDKGDPERFRIWKGQFYIYPKNRDDVRTLRMLYWAWSPKLSNDGENELSIRWPDLWVIRGTIEYFRAAREFKAANEWQGNARDPRPGTYLYELSVLKQASGRRKVPPTLGVRSNVHMAARRRLAGYPFWRWR